MPTYQYSCTECGHSLEAVQSFTDDSLTVCPECGGRLRKVFNAVGVVFKGSGFYRNDSRSTGTSTSPATAGSGDAKPDTSTKPDAAAAKTGESKTGESKTGESKPAESKPAAKTEARSA